MPPMGVIVLLILGVLVAFGILMAVFSRYRKCPSDRIMVIYGSRTGGKAARCLHGGAAFVWPVIQDYGYLSLRPLQIEVNLQNALSQQNIRISVPSIFTVGISTEADIMGNAAERLFGLHPEAITDLARDIIFGQLRLVIAMMTIEDINKDRETFLKNVMENVETELNKVGLKLINVNVTDLMDESGYIQALGQQAAAEAINTAAIQVAEEERRGSTGKAQADREKRIAVSKAEAEAKAGEAEADKNKRIAVRQAEAVATEGENVASIEIAKSNATRAEQEAEAYRKAESAKRIAEAQIQKANYEAEKQAQISRAEMEKERQRAEVIVPAEIQKQQIEIGADAEAEKVRREANGEANAIFAKLQAQAKGNYEVLKAKGEGFKEIINACLNNTDSASKLLLIEKLEAIVKLQTEAISNLKIDKITVWDSGSPTGDGKTSTAGFLSGMMKTLPPLHDVAGMAGIDLPDFLGKVKQHEISEPESGKTAKHA